ncbi:GAF and ANTAR domain-containing protein [Rhodococcus sp. 24CO]|uniref:GAF and ANTAR domain-containing protein n=1 Tax=Rhodococcus sp. 24CO TaxID=3117460 RepID=UPI003D341667
MDTSLPQVTIAEITHVLTTNYDSHNLLESITDRTRQSLTAAWCVLLVRATDPAGVEVVCESVAPGFSPHRDLVHSRPVALSASTGSVVMIDDFKIASHRWTRFADAAALSGLGACRIFPLRLAGQPLGALAVFTADPWNSRPRGSAYGQSMADLAAITLSMSGIDDRAEAATVAAQHILSSRAVIEQAAGMVAEYDNSSITAAMRVLAAQAKARGSTIAQYAEQVVEGRR